MAADPRLVGVSIEQQRRLVTGLPGPRSEELMARKVSAVAGGVGTTMGVFAAAASSSTSTATT